MRYERFIRSSSLDVYVDSDNYSGIKGVWSLMIFEKVEVVGEDCLMGITTDFGRFELKKAALFKK